MKHIVRILFALLCIFMYVSAYKQNFPLEGYIQITLFVAGCIAARIIIKFVWQSIEKHYEPIIMAKQEEEERKREEERQMHKKLQEVSFTKAISALNLDEDKKEEYRSVFNQILAKRYPTERDRELSEGELALMSEAIETGLPVPIEEEDYNYVGRCNRRNRDPHPSELIMERLDRDLEESREAYEDSYYYHLMVDDDWDDC